MVFVLLVSVFCSVLFWVFVMKEEKQGISRLTVSRRQKNDDAFLLLCLKSHPTKETVLDQEVIDQIMEEKNYINRIE